MSISNEALQKLLREVETQAIAAQQQISLVRTQQMSKQRELRMAQLTRSEISSLPADTNVYEGVGKMFVAMPVADMKGKLEGQIKEVEGEVDGLGKRLHYLEVSQKNSQDQIDRMLRGGAGPTIAHYVEAPPRSRPRYYETGSRAEDRFLNPVNERTLVTTRRSVSRDRRPGSPGSSAPQPPPAPVIINNRIYNNSDSESLSYSDSEDEYKRSRSHHRRHRSHSRVSESHSRERERELELQRELDLQRERDAYALEHVRVDYEKEIEMRRREYERDLENKRREFEFEQTRKELQEIKLAKQIEQEEKRRNKTLQEERDLRDAKKELDAIRKAKEEAEYERRVKQKLELERMKAEEAALEEKKRRDKEAKEIIDKYKREEAERKLREKHEAEQREKEYRTKMQEQLLKSGLDEKEINAILAGEKIKREKEKKEKEKDEKKDEKKMQVPPHPQLQLTAPPQEAERPVYTRMARRHLSLETLRTHNIDFQLDADPDYVLIKRWVDEPEQDILWRHTKIIREKRSSSTHSGKLIMSIEDNKKHRHHHHLEPEFEWVRKKERRRSRSPSLLMYFAGGRPS
ncbi:hypothetical protein F5Y11DRAFT_353046 [Daldinia sp. FL1419]|nr:hypothetical protein F5Y11DRAFT_353046 [Daldinia sp. FL1419]